ncbi:MAG: hypothetical protein MR296_00180 [Tenericutes bacterium]|nr:hypothetical protein [Mycoplasmatota bacterium]
MNKKKDVKKEEVSIEKRKQNLKKLKLIMVALDIICIPIIILQVKMNTFNIPSFVVLIVCNIIVFLSKIKETKN